MHALDAHAPLLDSFRRPLIPRDGRTVTSKYKLKLTGDALKGKVESDWSGDWQTLDWEATRAK